MSISHSWLAQTIELSRLTSIHPSLMPGDRISAHLYADGQLLGQLNYRAEREGARRIPALEFDLPDRSSELLIRGRLESAEGVASVFSRRWRLLKLGCISAALYGGSTLATGVVNFDRRLRALQQQAAGAYRSPLQVEMVSPGRHTAFVRAAARLTGAVPGELVDLCRLQITLGTGEFVAPNAAVSVSDGLRAQGLLGDNESDLYHWLSPATRARYDRSLLVFVDQANGGTGLAWDPHDVRAGEPTYSRVDLGEGGAVLGQRGVGVWYWVDGGAIDEPELLLERDRTPCNSRRALLQLFQQRVMTHRADPNAQGTSLVDYLLESAAARDNLLGEDLLVVDSASASDSLCLSFDQSGVRPQLRSWGAAEMAKAM